MKPFRRARYSMVAAAGLAACLLAPAQAATSHALILWIGDYGHPERNLPGIDKDARLARSIAMKMGVPSTNITELSNAALTAAGVKSAVTQLEQRVAPGDQVFLYFSGHGFQGQSSSGSGCNEFLVMRNGYYSDGEVQATLGRIGAKARQVVMMNDSCFSGGAASTRSAGAPVAKSFPGESIKGDVGQGEVYQCGNPINTFMRTFRPESIANRPNMVYLAASSAKEVAFATPNGSAATVAWEQCLTTGSGDANRSGAVTARELQACAQGRLRDMKFNQTLTTVGQDDLPLSFQGGGIAAGAGGAQVSPLAALRDVAQLADRTRRVTLTPKKDVFRIKQDFLEFTVSSDRAGYVYVLQAGSDGLPFNVLFPNDYDKNNYITAGSHVFPRAGSSLRMASHGPAGSSHLLAIVVDQAPNLSAFGGVVNGFRSAAATPISVRTFVAETTQAGGGSFGASAVVELKEVQ